MANSRKLRSVNLAEHVAAEVTSLLPAHSSILVGLSGGVDSVVLLHLLHKLSARFSWEISALHVHHGISPNADAWAKFCEDLCAELQITLHIERVDIVPFLHHGVEAAARKLRREAFAEQACDFVALAHHADDQVETLFLQLLRGAGVRGASAMPQFITRKGTASLIRPLLHVSRDEILSYATKHQLGWVEDESNANDSYPRNFLRHRVLPLLAEKFPAYRNTLARSAEHFAEAGHLLNEMAEQDAAGTIDGNTLSVEALRVLSHSRAKNLLRYFLHGAGVQMPQAIQLDDMLKQLCSARADTSVCVSCGDKEVRRYRGKAYVFQALGKFDGNLVMTWEGENRLGWPALNTWLNFNPTHGKGISYTKLQRAKVTLRLRQGGETMLIQSSAGTRTLKNLLQEKRIPPWFRDRLPMLYCGDELVCVPGVGTAAAYIAVADEAAVQVELQGAQTGNCC